MPPIHACAGPWPSPSQGGTFSQRSRRAAYTSSSTSSYTPSASAPSDLRTAKNHSRTRAPVTVQDHSYANIPPALGSASCLATLLLTIDKLRAKFYQEYGVLSHMTIRTLQRHPDRCRGHQTRHPVGASARPRPRPPHQRWARSCSRCRQSRRDPRQRPRRRLRRAPAAAAGAARRP